jgi:hypothetical protein
LGETRGSTWCGWRWGFEIPLGELDQRDPRHLLVWLEGPNSLTSSSPLAGLEKTSSPPTERKGRRRGMRRGVGSMGGGQPVRLEGSIVFLGPKAACASGKVTEWKILFAHICLLYKFLDMRFL